MRCAIVGSGTRKARAISSSSGRPAAAASAPPAPRSDSTGWQAMNIRRSRSSPIVVLARRVEARRSPAVSASCASSSRPSSSCLRSCSLSRRSRSSARCLAVVISQAPGLSGTPSRGQCSSAATSASCARSSARPTSRTMRATPAMIRGRFDAPDGVDRLVGASAGRHSGMGAGAAAGSFSPPPSRDRPGSAWAYMKPWSLTAVGRACRRRRAPCRTSRRPRRACPPARRGPRCPAARRGRAPSEAAGRRLERGGIG